jgi:hypothetical protein
MSAIPAVMAGSRVSAVCSVCQGVHTAHSIPTEGVPEDEALMSNDVAGFAMDPHQVPGTNVWCASGTTPEALVRQ